MTDVLIPGGRDVRGTIDEPDGEPAAIVVACPPHPQHRGSRTDPRLTAVSDALCEVGIACLRFDYGSWDEGYGEREDVRNAVRWARDADRFDRSGADLPLGVFGFSFGASQTLLAAGDVEGVDAVAVLAPTASLGEDLDALAALEELDPDLPVHVLYGERDDTVDWEPVVELARERGDEVTALSGDHFFIGKHDAIGETVAAFFERTLLD